LTPNPERSRFAMTNAVTYAEVELGVHEAYNEALRTLNESRVYGDTIVNYRDKIREIEARIAYREVQIMDDEWTKHPEMAVTRMDKHVKAAQLKDEELQELHSSLRTIKRMLDESELAKAGFEGMVRIESARMIELGGYLQYLAAAKTAQLVRATPEKQE
jgi:hypothetical protein